jgi:lipoprotein-anchoring transpeptidase ErfK/SrfK
MPDDFDQRVAAATARLEQEATVGSPAGVRARGDQRRRRHTATLAVTPVLVLAVAGTVGLTFRPSGGNSQQKMVRPPSTFHVATSAGGATSSASGPASTSMSTPSTPLSTNGTSAAAPVRCVVDLAHHTLTVLDSPGKVVRTLGITAGIPAYPTPTGTFTIVAKEESAKISSAGILGDYGVTVPHFIDLGPNGPALFGAAWDQAHIGKDDSTHRYIELHPDDAAWLYANLSVGDTIRIG